MVWRNHSVASPTAHQQPVTRRDGSGDASDAGGSTDHDSPPRGFPGTERSPSGAEPSVARSGQRWLGVAFVGRREVERALPPGSGALRSADAALATIPQPWVIQVIFSLIIVFRVVGGCGREQRGQQPAHHDRERGSKSRSSSFSVQRRDEPRAGVPGGLQGQFTPDAQRPRTSAAARSTGLIDRAVLGQPVAEAQLSIDDQELRDSIVDSPAFQVGGRFNKEHYLRVPRSAVSRRATSRARSARTRAVESPRVRGRRPLVAVSDDDAA